MRLLSPLLPLLAALLLASPVSAQPDGVLGTWVASFPAKDRVVYLDVRESALLVWAIHDRTECSMYPRRIRWEGRTIKGVVDWTLRRRDEDLQVGLGDTTVTYQRAETHPQSLCEDSEEI